jgi:hypothetical protein
MRQIFISYAQNDEMFAVRLSDDLRASGAQVWFDLNEVQPEDDWAQCVERALNESQMMVAILSPEALQSGYVPTEWRAYLEAHRPVIPVVLKSCSLPDYLQTLRPVDFTHDYNRAFHVLTARLLDTGMRTHRSDPIIWTMAEELREMQREQESPTAPTGGDEVQTGGLRRAMRGLRNRLRGGEE